MAANVDIEKQFLRLIMFCHKISLPVVRTFFVSGVIGCPDYNNDICTFLEHHKHKIFHLVGDYKCCQCTNLHSLQTLKFRLGNDQFKELYDVGLSQPGHFLRGSGGRVFQQCLCCVSVRKDTNPKNYDISLLFAILYNCVPLSDNSVSYLDTIRKSRNRLCHLNDLNDLSEIEINTLWGNLERSVTRLAGEIPSHQFYKESIEQHVDTFKYTDYNREAITPILESMRSEIKNNINEVIQNQMISQEEIRCLTNHVEQLSQNCKKDNQNMLNHVAESAKTCVDLHQDAVHQLSAQVAKCHTEEIELIRDQNKTVIESSEKVSGTMEHVMDKLNFLVDIAIDNKKFQHTQNGSILPKSGKSNERSTTQEQRNSEEQDKKCKLHWRIETPGYLEHKKEEIVKAMKNAIEIVKIGTSHEIENIHEGSITIDTLLPMSILQDKNAFHQSIRKFLEEMVSVCGIDPNIPLVVKVQITLSDLDQGSVKYSIGEMKHTTMINKAVQAVPTMLDRSTGSSELEIEEELDSTKGTEDDMMICSVNIKDNVLIPPSEMAFLQDEYDKDQTYMLLMGCSNDIIWIESVLTFCKSVALICHPGNKEKSKKLLNSKNINTFIYIASKSSQRSHTLKSMLQCLSESKHLQNNVITVVRDDVMISDLLKESKQIRVKINEKDWLPDLMDAIASSVLEESMSKGLRDNYQTSTQCSISSSKHDLEEDRPIGQDEVEEDSSIGKHDLEEDRPIGQDEVEEDSSIGKHDLEEDRPIGQDQVEKDSSIDIFRHDILILYGEKDHHEANECKTFLMNNFQHISNLQVALPEDLLTSGTHHLPGLNSLLDSCRLVFIYLTKNLESDQLAGYGTQMNILQSITDPLKEGRLIPLQVNDEKISVDLMSPIIPLKYVNDTTDDRHFPIFKEKFEKLVNFWRNALPREMENKK